jgi:hypothetical protein
MRVVRTSHRAPSTATGAAQRAGGEQPERVYVRREERGRISLRAWGIEHGGLLSEIVEPVIAGRPSAPLAIERDLRRGVGLS